MKKELYLLIIVSLVFLLTGCQKGEAVVSMPATNETKNIQSNTKLLKCSMAIDDQIAETVESTRTVEIFYQNYNISKITFILGYRLADKYAESAVTAIEQNVVTKLKNKYDKYAPIVIGTNRKGSSSFEITIEFEYTKLTAEEISELQLNYAGDYSEDRRIYENSGYTCE
jgi:hypothetical protein